MNLSEQLFAIEQIKQTKARYFRCLDTKDWPGLEAVFTPDVVIDVRGAMTDTSSGSGASGALEAGLFTSAAQFVRTLGTSFPGVETVHHGHMPEIEITSPTTARAVFAMEDVVRWPEGGPIRSMHGYGHYTETYEFNGTGWRIKTLRLTRLRVDLS